MFALSRALMRAKMPALPGSDSMQHRPALLASDASVGITLMQPVCEVNHMNVAVLSVLFLFLTGWMQQSCDTKEVALSREFQLKVGQEVLVKEAGIKVSLNAIVEDSRCPTGVQCIWAGNGKVSVKLSKAKTEAVSVELNTSAGPRSSTYQGYDVKLVGLDPYPKDGVTISKDAYTVTLMVCKNCGQTGGAEKSSASD